MKRYNTEAKEPVVCGAFYAGLDEKTAGLVATVAVIGSAWWKAT